MARVGGSFGLAVLTAAVAWCQSSAAVAVVRHGPTVNGQIDGSLQVVLPETTTLNGNATILGDLLVPGTPEIRLNGNPDFGGTIDGTGEAQPFGYYVTLNGRARVGHVVRRTDPLPMPDVPGPLSVLGQRNVMIDRPGQAIGSFDDVRNLTVNGGGGMVQVPPGGYGILVANGDGGFVVGVPEETVPVRYHFERLVLNGRASLRVVSPVMLTIGSELVVSGFIGAEADPRLFDVHVLAGGLTLNGGAELNGFVTVQSGTATLNGNARLNGGLWCDRLVLNGNAIVRLVPRATPPPLDDEDGDGMEDSWEDAYGLDRRVNDAGADPDGDGLSNAQEYQLKLRPNEADSDGDDLYDGDELELGLDPTLASPDAEPPSEPAELGLAIETTGAVTLRWAAATDNLRVAGYIVYRDGEPLDTDAPIRGTTFTDPDVVPGEEVTYQVRAFDFAGNLSNLTEEISIEPPPLDEDDDRLPDEWEARYFQDEPADPEADPDQDGFTTAEEFENQTDPLDFYNGVKPTLETVPASELGDENQVGTRVLKPDGTPWPGAPIDYAVDGGARRISATPAGPEFAYRTKVRAGPDGIARVYLEPLQP